MCALYARIYGAFFLKRHLSIVNGGQRHNALYTAIADVCCRGLFIDNCKIIIWFLSIFFEKQVSSVLSKLMKKYNTYFIFYCLPVNNWREMLGNRSYILWLGYQTVCRWFWKVMEIISSLPLTTDIYDLPIDLYGRMYVYVIINITNVVIYKPLNTIVQPSGQKLPQIFLTHFATEMLHSRISPLPFWCTTII